MQREASGSATPIPDASELSGETLAEVDSARLGPRSSWRGRYVILRLHAQGGLGTISVALDEMLGRKVALKQMRPEMADVAHLRRRFIHEAEITGQLEHPGIVPVYALGQDEQGRPYYAMKFVEGRTLDQAIAWRDGQRAQRRTVVWTNGVFDVLHVGHLASLRGARRFGEVLIVGVNGDASVRANKGPERPIYRCEERVALLAALELVDAILVFDDPTPERVLAQLKPDVHVKGADYAPPHGKPVPERAVVEAYGGRIEFLPLVPGRSSTDTLARLRS